ncbi:hypothetical protein MKX03_000491 [Papaver bracteatum]|nr:hypothetical protein MKX03_000491 [Papaver bracteatum]
MKGTKFLTLLLIILSLYRQSAGAEEDTPVSRFQNYLRFKTAYPNPDYSKPVSYLTTQDQSIGLKTTILEYAPSKPLLIITWVGSNPSFPSILLNLYLDSVPAEPSKRIHPPFAATKAEDGNIYARGAQDDKCIGMQYLEAIREMKFVPVRTVHVSYVPDEEIGGANGDAKFAGSDEFKGLNIGFMLDEGQASYNEKFRGLIIKVVGMPGHGSRMFDNSSMENLMKSVEIMTKYREGQFDLVKAGLAMNSEVISVNHGYQMNMQLSEVEARFNIRKIIDEWAPYYRNMTYEVSFWKLLDLEMKHKPSGGYLGCSFLKMSALLFLHCSMLIKTQNIIKIVKLVIAVYTSMFLPKIHISSGAIFFPIRLVFIEHCG